MTTIISGGSIKTLRVAPSSLPSRTGPSQGYVPLYGTEEYTDRLTGKKVRVSRSATYDLMYRRQPALYAVSTLLMKAFARLPMKAYQLDGEERERIRAHGLAKLIRRPYQRGSGWDWKIRLAYDLLIHGNHLQLKTRPASFVTGLQPVHWSRVAVDRDSEEITGYWVYHSDKSPEFYLPDAVIHYQMPGGVSPVEVLGRTLALEDAATTYQGASLQNGVTPRAAFSFKNGIKQQDREFVRTELEKLYTGPENASRFALLTSDATVSPIGVSAVDLALIDQRKLSRDECCAVYNISPSIVGWTGDKAATFASAKEFHSALYVDALGPIVTLAEETMQAQLVDEEPAWDGLFVEFDMNELLRPDVMDRMRAYLLAQQSSTSTIDDRRRAENQRAFNITGVTDVPLIPVNMRPATQGMFEGEPVSASAVSVASAVSEQLVKEALGTGSPTEKEDSQS